MDSEYHKQKSREHYQKYKQKYNERNALQRERTKQVIAEAKIGGCTICDESTPVCLDFHHLGDKDMEVSKMWGMNDDKVRKEIEKCVLLCSNCHSKVHAGILNIPS
jgi:hypothetical protein